MFIRASDLSQMLHVSKCTLWRWSRSGRLPKPLKLSDGVAGWLESDISEWLRARKSEAEEKCDA
jgi:predicted DNA-binding transcriptional regulator AlpA